MWAVSHTVQNKEAGSHGWEAMYFNLQMPLFTMLSGDYLEVFYQYAESILSFFGCKESILIFLQCSQTLIYAKSVIVIQQYWCKAVFNLGEKTFFFFFLVRLSLIPSHTSRHKTSVRGFQERRPNSRVSLNGFPRRTTRCLSLSPCVSWDTWFSWVSKLTHFSWQPANIEKS